MKLIIIILYSITSFAQEIPANVKILMKHYPQITGYKDNKLLFSDRTTLIYDDGKIKSKLDLINNPDIEDQFFYNYPKNTIGDPKNDAGRIRNDAFFKKIYGQTSAEVQKHLTEIVWCPKLVNQKIKVTTVNGLDKIFKNLSTELDQYPDYKKYISNIGGTFNWRKISGTNRMSMHSFGMTIDINTKYSNYWQWDCNCKNEDGQVGYKNKLPAKLIQIFEKHGFIWGGRWQHYDTMHFEYRPEMF